MRRISFPRRKKHSAAHQAEVAIAHDYLTQRGGAERVVLALHKAFPDAPIYTTLYDPERTYPEFKNANIQVSPLNHVKVFRQHHRLALPFLAFISQRIKVPAQQTIVSTAGWAHGFNIAGKSLVYCHTPARWLYLTDQYFGKTGIKALTVIFKRVRPLLISWDQKSARGAGKYLANSSIIQERIRNVYGFDVPVLFPPHTIDSASAQQPLDGLEDFLAGDNYFIVVSRLLPYKNVDAVVEAFSLMPHQKLLVVGRGPQKQALEEVAGENVRFASEISDAQMRYAYSHSLGLIAVSYEDFGLTPLEAGAYGKPTLALHAGGFLDTIEEDVNGVFIEHSTPANIAEGVERMLASTWDSELIMEHVKKFSEERFIEMIKLHLEELDS